MKAFNELVAMGIVVAAMGASSCVVAERGPGYDHPDRDRDDRRAEHRDEHRCDREHDEHCEDRFR
jgi:hypothetical protein